MTLKPIKSRLVLYFPGLETLQAKPQLERFKYSVEQSGKIWGFKHKGHVVDDQEYNNHAVSISKTTATDWETETKFVLLDWSDVASSYINTPYPKNLLKYIPSFLAFFLDGSNYCYFKTSKRYWMYTFFPLVFILTFILVSWLFTTFSMAYFAPTVTGWAMVLLKTILVTMFTTLLCKWPGDRLLLNLAINMSGFSRSMAKGGNPTKDKRTAEFAKIMEAEIKAEKYDEVLIAAHSTGVIWAVLTLSKVLQKNPNVFQSTNATVLSFGSNLPRSALAPCAGYLRNHLKTVMDCPNLFWHEFMTKDDIVSFYKADTMSILGISNPTAKYTIDCIRFKLAMLPERYKKMRKSIYRTHKQYVLHHDKPVYFDFMLRCFGPFLSSELALNRNWVEDYFKTKNREVT